MTDRQPWRCRDCDTVLGWISDGRLRAWQKITTIDSGDVRCHVCGEMQRFCPVDERKGRTMRFAAPSIVREAIAYAILGIQLWYLPKDIPEKLRQETLNRYYPIFREDAVDIASDVYDWFVARSPITGDLELAQRCLFLELWRDKRFGIPNE